MQIYFKPDSNLRFTKSVPKYNNLVEKHTIINRNLHCNKLYSTYKIAKKFTVEILKHMMRQ